MNWDITVKKQISQILFVFAILIAYLFNNVVGCVLMIACAIFNLIKYKGCIVLLRLLIMSLPLSFVGVMGTSMHQVFSWYNLFLVLYLVFILSSGTKYSGMAILGTTAISGLLILGLLWYDNTLSNAVEIIQVLIMLIPLVLSFQYNNVHRYKVAEVLDLLTFYSNVCVAAALANIVQYIAYNRSGLRLGFIEQTGLTRMHYNLFFKGFSVMPIFLGVGFIILFIKCVWSKYRWFDVINMIVIFLAMIINSSRTGLFCVCIVAGIILVKALTQKVKIKYLLILIFSIFMGTLGIRFLMASRSLSSFTDDNGRYETYINGIQIWLSNIRTFLIGEGLAGGAWEHIMTPHNLIIQTLAQCGIFVSIIIFAFFCSYLKANKRNLFIFIPIYLLLSGMLITDFYANAFSCTAFIITDMFRTACYDDETVAQIK